MKKSVQLIHPIGHGGSRQKKSMRDEELISRNAEHLTIVKYHTLVNVATKNDFLVWKTANSYWQTVYVYASIRYADNVSLTSCSSVA